MTTLRNWCRTWRCGCWRSRPRQRQSYWIGKPCWGNGYCTEAAKAVLHYGFTVLGLNRIYATHMSRNPASGRVMEKIGMVQILYNDKTDLLYLRLDERKQQVINKGFSEDIVLDIGEDDRSVGIEAIACEPSEEMNDLCTWSNIRELTPAENRRMAELEYLRSLKK